MLKDFVGDDIKKFAPNVIVISYSGRIKIINDHFEDIIKELASISSRKCLLYPNFTSIHIDKETNREEEMQELEMPEEE